MEKIIIKENGLLLHLGIDDEKKLSLLYFGGENPQEWEIMEQAEWSNSIMELQLSGAGSLAFPGMKIAGTLPGVQMRYASHKVTAEEQGNRYCFVLRDEAEIIEARITWQFYRDVLVLRSQVEVENLSNEELGLEYLSSFKMANFDRTPADSKTGNVLVSVPHNSWLCEVDWKQLTMEELGFDNDSWDPSKRLYFGNTSTFSSNQFVPMAVLENRYLKGQYFFQLENQGAWNWEINSQSNISQLVLSGPGDVDNQGYKKLVPGEVFTSIPVAIGYTQGNFSHGIQELTKYRRIIRRPNEDNEKLPVIFNDYMNCLFGDPTTEKELPLIKAAAEVGCEVFCIDCGWYADKGVSWWPSIGDWQPSKTRFPEGLTYLTNFIKEQGMVPGLWLELESAGVTSELAKTKPDNWFFTRHGKRVVNRDRLQLDFRNPEVREYCFNVVKRLVEEYGVGYIKMDYNINAGPGPDINADSVGMGLLENNRAHLEWLRGIFAAFPDLTIENCSSGGMRMDYAMLAECSLQSVSDQTDRDRNSAIAALAATAVTPEQDAIWSYPNKDESKNEVIQNMVNAMMGRIHQSGFIQEMAADKLALVAEGIACYKEYRSLLKEALPFWPMGILKQQSSLTYGLHCGKQILLAVWNFDMAAEIEVELSPYLGGKVITKAQVIYPQQHDLQLSATTKDVTVVAQKGRSCVIRIDLGE